MTEGRKPQRGDRVRVTFEADFVSGDDDDSRHAVVDIADGMGPIRIGIPAWSTFEVLTPAYACSNDLIGTVRGMGANRQPWVKRNENEWVCITHDETTDDREMERYPIIGTVPGTPAAEAQPKKPTPRVFKADGETGTVEEPPDWVTMVVDKHGDHLRRKEDGWIGYGGEGYPILVKPWEDHVLPKYAPYTEVV